MIRRLTILIIALLISIALLEIRIWTHPAHDGAWLSSIILAAVTFWCCVRLYTITHTKEGTDA